MYFKRPFGLRLVVSRLLVYLGRGQTALRKGKRSSLSIPVCRQQRQNSKVIPVSWYSAVLSVKGHNTNGEGKMHHRSNTHGYLHNKNTDQNFKALYKKNMQYRQQPNTRFKKKKKKN